MTMFYLARHGQTAWNRDKKFRGRKDVPLSEAGEAEANAMADHLAGEGIDRIIASPLSRAMNTLEPLAKRLGKEVIPHEDLIDMDFGEWEGLNVERAEKLYSELFEVWKRTPEQVTFPGGENLPQVQARAMRAISRLAVEYPEDKIAVCSHRVISKLVILGLLGVKSDRFWSIQQDTACLNRFSYKPPKAIIFSVNDTRHLEKLGGTLRADF